MYSSNIIDTFYYEVLKFNRWFSILNVGYNIIQMHSNVQWDW